VALEKEFMKERDGVELFAFRGMEDGEIDRQSVGAMSRTIAEDDFAEDDGMAEGLFGVIVGGGHAVNAQESEEAVVIALWVDEALAQVLGFRTRNRFAADVAEPTVERRDFGLSRGEGNLPLISASAKFTDFGKKGSHLPTESKREGVLLGRRQISDELGNLLSLADQMSQTGLTILGFDEIVSGVIIGDETALEAGAEDVEGDLSGTGVIDVKEPEAGVAGKPEVGALAVDAPVGFVAVDDVGGADLVADLFMDGFGGSGGALLEGHGGGGDKVQAKEALEDFTHAAEGKVKLLTQENGGGFGGGADGAVAKFALGGLKDRAAAVGAKGGVVLITSDEGFGLEDDILLELLLLLAGGQQAGGGAMRAGGGRRHTDGAVDMFRWRSVPRRMALGRPAFAVLSRSAEWLAVGFETGSVLSLEACP